MAHCPVAAQMLGSEEIGTACTLDWEVIDVGGQRGERRKWMNTLTDALGLIFTVGLSEYAQVLYEDPDTIRMQESLDLFDKWANHPDFARKPVVVAFTKKDIFYKNFDLEKFKVCAPRERPRHERPRQSATAAPRWSSLPHARLTSSAICASDATRVSATCKWRHAFGRVHVAFGHVPVATVSRIPWRAVRRPAPPPSPLACQAFFTDFEVPEGAEGQAVAEAGIKHVEKRVRSLLKDQRKKIVVRRRARPSRSTRARPPLDAPLDATAPPLSPILVLTLPLLPLLLQTFYINTTDKDDFFDMLEGLKEIVAKHNNGKIMDAVQKGLDAKKDAGGMAMQGNANSDVPKGGGGCCTIA